MSAAAAADGGELMVLSKAAAKVSDKPMRQSRVRQGRTTRGWSVELLAA